MACGCKKKKIQQQQSSASTIKLTESNRKITNEEAKIIETIKENLNDLLAKKI